MIVVICGSMRFFKQMLETAADETAKGHIVLAPFAVVAPEDQGSDFKTMLDELHIEKIDMADQVIVVTNQHRYVGESTIREMNHAQRTGKEMVVREFHILDAAAGVPQITVQRAAEVMRDSDLRARAARLGLPAPAPALHGQEA